MAVINGVENEEKKEGIEFLKNEALWVFEF
jgi:hypothetical protein